MSMNYMPAALALALTLVSSSFAQPATTTTPPNPADNYVTEKNFKSRVFDVKYRDPNTLAGVLKQLGSGFKGATIYPSTEFKTLTVRDFPENIATIEEALKRLDTPGTPRPNIELHMFVLVASNTGSANSDVPAELKEVLTQLRTTLNYKNYELAAAVVQRLTETSNVLEGSGIADVSSGPGTQSAPTPYEYYIRNVTFVQNAMGAPTLQIGEFTFRTLTQRDMARVETALSMRDGEKVVVGTATIRDRALVIVLTSTLVK